MPSRSVSLLCAVALLATAGAEPSRAPLSSRTFYFRIGRRMLAGRHRPASGQNYLARPFGFEIGRTPFVVYQEAVTWYGALDFAAATRNEVSSGV